MNVPDALRLEVWRRASGHCEYCLILEADLLFPHHVDHVRASQHGGLTLSNNLALACSQCNRSKGPNLSSVDPESGQPEWLFNPRAQRWADHFGIEGPFINGVTSVGRASAFLLQFNDDERVRLRKRLQRLGRFPTVALGMDP